jgi:multimeric flavodoxin WrbA/nitrite reductase/ring-hydroxylating ferredoxin subunit
MSEKKWYDLGPVESLKARPLQEIIIERTKIALSYADGRFGAISGICNHVGGPLGQGRLDGEFVVCPWHNYKFRRIDGKGEPGYEEDRVPQYELKEENGHLFINLNAVTQRNKLPHPPHPLARPVKREDGPIRVVGISTTVMDPKNPRYSTSVELLKTALQSAADQGAETQLISLYNLKFRNCEGYYSKSAFACTWPCSITQMDPEDELTSVYEAIVHWADVTILATPIRWGAASSLYYRMVERMNCVQNQITIRNKVLIQNKVASFIITGGQDNIQAVAGQMLGFFAEIGFIFPSFPYIAHSLGWTAENMERNVAYVKGSPDLHEGARDLARRSIEMSKVVLGNQMSEEKVERGGRKAHHEKGESVPGQTAEAE